MVTALMLRASSEIANRAKDELSLREYSPLQIANDLGIAVQLVENFLNGEIVDLSTYNLICGHLNIPFQELGAAAKTDAPKLNIAPTVNARTNNNDSKTNSKNKPIDQNGVANSSLGINSPINEIIGQKAINDLVNLLRQNLSEPLIRQCDRLRIIDVNYPLKLSDLYVDINVFSDLSSSQYLDFNEIFANVSPEQYDRFYLEKLYPQTITVTQALEENQKILLVGRLGSGKTTLLKYWAFSCISANILANYLPIFLSLPSLYSSHHFSEINSPNYVWDLIKSQIRNYGLASELADEKILAQLLQDGRLLLLWDGLDEIPEIHRAAIAQQLQNFSDRYPQNRLVIATRNPVYGHLLESFQVLEMAPFKDAQIAAFATKWFQKTCPQKPKKIDKFQQLLNTNQPLTEVASNPLFLTYLCNFFNSYEYLKPNFYQEILNLLLTKWEQTKCLSPNHDQAEHRLSNAQKQDLLSYIAIVALDRHGYVWQNNELEDDFQDCIRASRSLGNLTIDRDHLFQTLKWQHSLLVECSKGVHCLTHTTLHDYLAAYRIANSNPNAAQKYLLERMYLKRWHGVIVMTVSISRQADRVLQQMKRKIDELVVKDPHLQSFLTWVNQQSIQMKTPYKAATIRALYLDIDLENTRSLDRARALDIAHSRSLERARMRAMGIDNTMETEVDIDYTINLALNLDLALYFANHPVLELACTLEPDLHKGLQLLRQKFPDPYKDREKFAKWWQAKGLDWSKKLRSLIVQHRKGSQEWQFSENQLKILRTYHEANKLLIECLNNAEYVTPLVKSQIESTLLLPQGEYTILQY
ncbi:NACHT domain-containing protein [Pseudanabaena sp. FACHB-1998]|uniref:NACHT domain-containing protein n=1 Tax=Pseudanabaena sp. FACHB-1998 TaxID=2692858 RepID=UPI0016804D5F|nr:NACHT domain-containing protein [Pseudanabaena sp. FACHB-1998]MBD2175355.1 NACHT domain-containing protein [Pseudanabaena sp. FACHB-1998]